MRAGPADAGSFARPPCCACVIAIHRFSGQRRTGKTTFLLRDLIPALEQEGALVIYVDLWTDTRANPAQLVRSAIAKALEELQTPGSTMLAKLARVSGVDVGARGFKFGFKLDKIGQPDGAALAQVVTELVDQASRGVVLVVDEVQQAITTEEGNQLLLGLKAARDAINPRPGTPGHFIFLGTGSHRAMVSELTARRTQAFNGATSIPYPVLDADYVDFILGRIARDNVPHRRQGGPRWRPSAPSATVPRNCCGRCAS